MCGRYTIFTEAEIIEMNAIIAEVGRRFGAGAVSTGEIFPTNIVPVLKLEGSRLAPHPVSWGFPKWSGKGVNINARTDTILNALHHPEERSIWREPIMIRTSMSASYCRE